MAKICQTGKRAAGLLVCAVLLGGCGAVKVPDKIEDTSLIIEKEGSVISYTAGFFDKSYYKLPELRSMAQEEVALYNAAKQVGKETPVLVEDVTGPGENGRVVVSYRYDSTYIYEDYNDVPLFYGTVEQARKAGKNFSEMNQVLFGVKGNESILSADLNDDGMAGRHVVLVEEPTFVYCPYKVAYISEGASVLENGAIDTTGVEPEAYPVIIVLKK